MFIYTNKTKQNHCFVSFILALVTIVTRFFFVRIYSIRISRLRFGQNILGISKNNRLGMRLTVLNESLHHGMQFKAISGGGEGTEFEKLKLEVKNNRAWEKMSPFL